MAVVASVPTPSQLASAQLHLSRRDQWRYARNTRTGKAFIVMPSSDGKRVYYVGRDGRGCTCEGARRYPICSHQLAAREAAHHDALAAWLDDQPASDEPAPAPVQAQPAGHTAPLKRYEDLFPTCAQPGCDDDPEPGTRHCWRHLPVRVS